MRSDLEALQGRLYKALGVNHKALEGLVRLRHSCTSPPSLDSLANRWKEPYNALKEP